MFNRDTCIIIPARSGSKGIPDKNIIELNGKSLLYRALEISSKLTDLQNVCLSTDSQKYYDHIKDKFSPIFLKRSRGLSQDNSLALDVWKDAVLFMYKNYKKYDFSLFLEPTSPIRDKVWIENIMIDFKNSKDDLWMSVKETDSKYRIEKQFYIDKNGKVNYVFKNNDIYSLRQNSKKTYHKDGVFYIAKNKYILETNSLFGGIIKGIVNKNKSVNIDTFEDLNYAKFLLQKNS